VVLAGLVCGWEWQEKGTYHVGGPVVYQEGEVVGGLWPESALPRLTGE
jgi:hypothetical protein